jgi:NADH-quinone oxidoreductase subunit A
MPALVLFLLVFLAVAIVFLFFHMLMGSVLRPSRPEPEKLTIYECGEPTVGSAWIQFDLRYYVVALLFVVFDVEVAFFFPWAVVFGSLNATATTLQASEGTVRNKLLEYAEADYLAERHKLERKRKTADADAALGNELDANRTRYEEAKKRLANASDSELRSELEQAIYLREFKLPLPALPDHEAESERMTARAARSWAWVAFLDILVFFGVLMMGFAYLWRRGDIDWVRTITHSEPIQPSAEALPPSRDASELATVETNA